MLLCSNLNFFDGGREYIKLPSQFNMVLTPPPHPRLTHAKKLRNFILKMWLHSLNCYVSFSGFLSFFLHLWLKMNPCSRRYQLWTRVCSPIGFFISLTQVSYEFKCFYLKILLPNLIKFYKMIHAACNNYSAIHLILAIPLIGSFGASL